MRTIRYAVINTKTNEKLFTSNSYSKCENFLNAMENNDGCAIGHKWFSI